MTISTTFEMGCLPRNTEILFPGSLVNRLHDRLSFQPRTHGGIFLGSVISLCCKINERNQLFNR